jgi:adenosine/AMP kinase
LFIGAEIAIVETRLGQRILGTVDCTRRAGIETTACCHREKRQECERRNQPRKRIGSGFPDTSAG